MKHLLCKLLLAVYLLPTIAFGQSTRAQIKFVEHGLLPAVLIKGYPE
jgi:hypothetical protein